MNGLSGKHDGNITVPGKSARCAIGSLLRMSKRIIMTGIPTDPPAPRPPCGRAASRRIPGVALLFLAALVLGLLFNGTRPLWESSETRYAEAAREMARGGDWLVPRIEGVPHLTKPPLAYWVLAAGMRALGEDEWVVRLPLAVAFALGVVLTSLLAGRLFSDRRVALRAGLLQMMSPLAFAGGHVVTTDIFVSLFVLAYLWCMWGALLGRDDRRARAWALGMHAFLALAFLTKGPPAMLPALAAAAFVVLRRRSLPWRRLVAPGGLALLLAGSLSWFVAVLATVPGAASVWRQEAVHKVFVDSARDMSPLLYIPILAGGALPAVLLLVCSGWFPRRPWMPAAGRSDGSRARLFLLLWCLLPLAVFMAARTRLPLYVLPLVPALNILAASESRPLWPAERRRGIAAVVPLRTAITVGLWLCLMVAAKVFVADHGDPHRDLRPVAAAIRADVRERRATPEVVLTMPRAGNGLLYYLDGPASRRTRVGGLPAANVYAGRSQSLMRVLAAPVDAGVVRYVVSDAPADTEYHGILDGWARVVYSGGGWTVWGCPGGVPPIPGAVARDVTTACSGELRPQDSL